MKFILYSPLYVDLYDVYFVESGVWGDRVCTKLRLHKQPLFCLAYRNFFNSIFISDGPLATNCATWFTTYGFVIH